MVEKTVNYIYDRKDPPLNTEQRDDFDGNMPNEVRGELAYKVRPLNGVWATPPYLHNGSVPNVYAAASPVRRKAEEILSRPPRIRSGEARLQVRPITNGFEFDTSIRGNCEYGARIRRQARKDTKGMIGKRTLVPDERKAIIEFLKTL